MTGQARRCRGLITVLTLREQEPLGGSQGAAYTKKPGFVYKNEARLAVVWLV